MNKTRSDIHKYFTTLPDGRKQCKFCNNERIYSGTSPTTPLWAHVRKYHSGHIGEKSTPEPLTAMQQEKITTSFIKWIVNSNQSFTVSDHKDFRDLIQNLNEGYKVPCRQTTQKLVMEKFEYYKAIIQNILQHTPGDISLTCDIWTSITMESYIGITAHFIDDKWQLCYLTLDIQPMPHPHTGTAIKDTLLTVINGFSIQHKISSIVTDNGANMIKGSNLLAEEVLINNDKRLYHIRCGAHTINLVVQAGFQSMFNIEQNLEEEKPISPLTKLRLCVNAIRRSPKTIEDLKNYCHVCNIKYHNLPSDCPTRWSSTFSMVKASIDQKQALQTLFSGSEIKNIKNALDYKEWETLESKVKDLEIFSEATNVLSTFLEPTIHLVEEVYLLTKQHLNKENTDATKAMENKLLEYIPKLSDVHWITQVLHPGIKLNLQDKRNKSKMIEFKKKAVEISKILDEACQEPLNILTKISHKKRKTSFQRFQELINETIVVDGRAATRLHDPDTEINAYLSSTKAERDCDILSWWQDHKKEFPVLAALAQNYFAIPASSVPCEQLFSNAGNTITKTRNSLMPDTAQALLCLQSWISFAEEFVE